MAENLKRQPKKGILKNSSSFEGNDRPRDQKPATKWDEMNIIATLHPADKDYGHMKIEEPKTPYNYAKDYSGSGDELDCVDADLLTKRLQATEEQMPRALSDPLDEDSEEEEDDNLPPEEKEKRRSFEVKRKKHYNEFQAVKLARKLMEDDSEDEQDDTKAAGNKQQRLLQEHFEEECVDNAVLCRPAADEESKDSSAESMDTEEQQRGSPDAAV